MFVLLMTWPAQGVAWLAGKYINICAVVHFIIPLTIGRDSLVSWWLKVQAMCLISFGSILDGNGLYVPQCLQTDSGTHPASCFIGKTASFQRVKWWGLKLTIHLHLVVQRLRMCGAIHPFLYVCLWCIEGHYLGNDKTWLMCTYFLDVFCDILCVCLALS